MCPEVIAAIKKHCDLGVVEIGGGLGYWAKELRDVREIKKRRAVSSLAKVIVPMVIVRERVRNEIES